MAKDTIAFDIEKARKSEACIRAKLYNVNKIFNDLQKAVDSSATWWEGTSHDECMRRADELIARKAEVEDVIKCLANRLAKAISEKIEEEEKAARYIAARTAELTAIWSVESSLDGMRAPTDAVESGHGLRIETHTFTEDEMWEVMIELFILHFKDINEQEYNSNPSGVKKLSDQELRQYATAYAIATQALIRAEKDADGYIFFSDLDEEAQKAIFALNGTPCYDGSGPVDPFQALGNVCDNAKVDIITLKDSQNQYVYSEQSRAAAGKHNNSFQINQEVLDYIAFRAIVPNSDFKNLVIGGGIIALMAAVYTVPLWGPAAIGLLQTAGTSAVLSAKDMIAQLLSEPALLLANKNVQTFLSSIIIDAMESISIEKNSDDQYTVTIDGKKFAIDAGMDIVFHTVGEIYIYWGEAQAHTANVGNAIFEGMGSIQPGSLSSAEARQWYLDQASQIKEMIDTTKPFEQQARQAFVLGNQIRTQARELMSDRATAESLYKTDPNMTWDQVVAKYTSDGLSGDSLWQAIIDAST